MKRLGTFLLGTFLLVNCWAQSPEKLSYQAVVRNSDNQLITNQTIGIKISIIRGSILSGSVIYTETQTPQTNSNGLINIEIGEGAGFDAIDWANGTYFIRTETDPTGGTNYSITGASQLLSVPYALHAKTAETVIDLEITGDETTFNNWDKDSSDDFDGQYNNLTGAPTNVSEFSNDAGYLTTESDPVFSASNASQISSTDMTNISNLSGVNTGDQDLSGLATKSELETTETAIRGDIPNIDGSETHITAGANVAVTGSGTSGEPYEISASISGSSNHYIGEEYDGGVVFYVDETGEHGLIASLTDMSTDAYWNNYRITGATSSWNGSTNTALIVGGASPGDAVLLATEYRGGGYSDWYLPAIDELVLLANARYTINKALSSISGATELSFAFYWSSTEYSSGQAYVYRFNYLRASFEHKLEGAGDGPISVRAIRKF